MRSRALRWLALVIGALLLVAGCGVEANDAPQAIAPENLPPGLLDPNPSSSTSEPGPGPTEAVPVYLLARDGETTRLAAVEREVTDPEAAGQRLTALLTAPSEAELAQGLNTSIPTDTVLLRVEFNDRSEELTVDLSDELFAIQGAELANAFAQIVFTALELDGVRQVRFLVEGEPIQAPDAQGRPVEGAVTRANYASLAPR